MRRLRRNLSSSRLETCVVADFPVSKQLSFSVEREKNFVNERSFQSAIFFRKSARLDDLEYKATTYDGKDERRRHRLWSSTTTRARVRHAQKKIKPSWWSHLSRRLAVDDDWTLPGRSGDLLQSHLAHALHVLRDPAFAHAFEFRKSPQILLIVVLFFSLFRGGSVVLLSRGGRRGEPPHRQSGIVDCGHFLFLFFVRTRKAAIFFALFLAGKLFIYFFSFCFFFVSNTNRRRDF